MISFLDDDLKVTKEYDADTINKATSLALLLAGVDVTTGTLTWALCLLLNNPETLKRAQEELDQNVGSERQVKESDLDNLVYVHAVLKEAMRLYPPGPLAMAHVSREDCIVGGYHIPAKTPVFVNIGKIQLDPNLWPEPNEFRPERFLTTHKNIDVRGQDFELLPFSSGEECVQGYLWP
ncbi:cytochrome P450 CYP82D47-like [Prunus yedoensis var. nudiflora]|uniref:Cytochrome P450 CYP82D47-like n=1 Tax=Prunus yedoensis var. nudiflora TaxID=2094558 RepID=A0A314XTR5_PRUYE|nr:cytochrome P450 CYP82D47-like [Prunus yedoensis var. nudiflora]